MPYKPIITSINFEKQLAHIRIVDEDENGKQITVSNERVVLSTVLDIPVAPPSAWANFAKTIMVQKMTALRNRKAEIKEKADAEVARLEAAKDEDDTTVIPGISHRGLR
ncbi:MAG: hypothetical protein Unbinned3891contig1000_94 [Prokaryotic dsDNA virus sp.]|nr:MAG: hypothetical protein Unbinned3891contig1000_94 [Prokaryotic dsDNA virus sp.]|tara:strand:- start:33656 stop:33982 length:327 start_codon:yes stop_codon:yes gene_type:complete